MQFTAAIPTYNGASGYLSEVLDALLKQKTKVEWELIVVDNNSKDDTKKLVMKYKKKFKNLKYVFEGRQGAGYARNTAVKEAKGEFVGFLDDDNVPNKDWIEEAYRFGLNHPEAGAWSGNLYPKYEAEPPKNFDRIKMFFAIRESKNTIKQKGFLTPSAGLVVRKTAWLECVPDRQIITGRTDNTWVTGEDIEAMTYLHNNNWEIWHNPKIKITHIISRERFSEEYLRRFFKGVGLCRFVTRMLRCKKWQRPLMLPLFFLNDIRKIVVHLAKYRSEAWKDPVARGEMNLYFYSLVSPFYWIGRWRGKSV